MTTTITLVDDGYQRLYAQTSPDTAMLQTALGPKRADTLVGCTKAARQLDGQDVSGHVTYTAKYGGLCGNALRVRHVTGGTGVGYEGRALNVVVLGLDVTVVFGTDGAGVSVTPTAGQVASAVASKADAVALLSAVASGTGAGLVSIYSDYLNLQGGLDDGDALKFFGSPNVCRPVNLRETA